MVASRSHHHQGDLLGEQITQRDDVVVHRAVHRDAFAERSRPGRRRPPPHSRLPRPCHPGKARKAEGSSVMTKARPQGARECSCQNLRTGVVVASYSDLRVRRAFQVLLTAGLAGAGFFARAMVSSLLGEDLTG
jgi:hypothetical protein